MCALGFRSCALVFGCAPLGFRSCALSFRICALRFRIAPWDLGFMPHVHSSCPWCKDLRPKLFGVAFIRAWGGFTKTCLLGRGIVLQKLACSGAASFYKRLLVWAQYQFTKSRLFRRGIVLQKLACSGASSFACLFRRGIVLQKLACSGAASFYKSLLVRANHSCAGL